MKGLAQIATFAVLFTIPAAVLAQDLGGVARPERSEGRGSEINTPFEDSGRATLALQGDPVLVADNAFMANGQENANGNGNGDEEPENIKDNSFFIEEAYNQEPGVAQHIFNWIEQWGPGGNNRCFTFNYTMELPIHSQDHQFSFVFPVEEFFEDPNGGPAVEEGGVGDILLNYRYQLVYETETCPAVAPRFSLILPTGDEDRGLGNGTLGYQFNLPVSKEIDPFAFHFNAGFTYIPDVTVPVLPGLDVPGLDLRGYNLGVSAIWLYSLDLNFLLECVAFFDEEIDDFGNRDQVTEILLNPAFRWAAYTKDELQWVLGVGVPIGLTDESPDIGVFLYMSVEHPFKDNNANGGH